MAGCIIAKGKPGFAPGWELIRSCLNIVQQSSIPLGRCLPVVRRLQLLGPPSLKRLQPSYSKSQGSCSVVVMAERYGANPSVHLSGWRVALRDLNLNPNRK
jgi:hypothetical protein